MSKRGRGEERGIMDRARDALGFQTQEPQVQTQELPGLRDRRASATEKRKRAAAAVAEADAAEREMEQEDEANAALAQEAENKARRFWPDAKPLPETYYRRQTLPCPSCRRVLTDSNSCAAVVQGSTKEVAYLRCKVCGHTWKLAAV